MLNNKQKTELKRIAHSSELQKYNIGKGTIDNSVVDMLDKAITKYELIKISFLKSSLTELSKNEMASDISSKLNAEIVQIIGNTAIFYRKNSKLKDSIKI